MTQRHVPEESQLLSRTAESEIRSVSPTRWRDAVSFLLGHDHVFCSLHATESDGTTELRAAFMRDGNFLMITCQPDPKHAPTIVDLVPAASWDEREATDLARITFTDHRTRPLVTHTDRLDSWVTRVTGHDTHQVAVGPIHAGIIESGHFRFHVIGERILHLDLRLFYKHRGLENAARGQSLDAAIAVAQRACAACAVSNSVAYAQACENALGLVPAPELASVRTLLLELERLYNHLNDIAAACAGVGFAIGNMRFAALKEQAHRINHALTGHRFLFDAVSVGSSNLGIPAGTASSIRNELAKMRVDTQRAWHEVLFNSSVQNRFDGVGVLASSMATALGTVGPAARACGLRDDQRTHSPRLTYAAFQPAVPSTPGGDVRARVEVRVLELATIYDLLDALLDRGISTSRCETGDTPVDTGMSVVESPRGRTFCTVERTDSTLTRVRLRTASYANWPALAVAAADNLLPEFPLINKSFELCYACCDR